MFKLNVYDKVIDGGTEGIISNTTIPDMAVLQGAMSTFERTESWARFHRFKSPSAITTLAASWVATYLIVFLTLLG